MIVTTTNHIEGYKIQKYAGVVSAHIVAGTNLFSDIAAEVRDIIGGKSHSYQKQLENLDVEIIDLLVEKTRKNGGNAIYGLKIDYDEISGKGKSMLMVNAIGTAVLINASISEDSSPLSGDLNFIKDNIERKKRLETKAALVYDGVNTEQELLLILDKEIETDVEFYEFIINHPRLKSNGAFAKILNSHRNDYFDRKDKEKIKSIEDNELKKREEAQKKLDDINTRVENLTNEIQKALVVFKKIEEGEEKELKKMFGRDIDKILYAYTSLKFKSTDFAKKCCALIEAFNMADECGIAYEQMNKEKVEKLLNDVVRIEKDIIAKEATLRMNS